MMDIVVIVLKHNCSIIRVKLNVRIIVVYIQIKLFGIMCASYFVNLCEIFPNAVILIRLICWFAYFGSKITFIYNCI